MFVRIKFLAWSCEAEPYDEQVVECPRCISLQQVAGDLLKNGVYRNNRYNRDGNPTSFYDEGELIMPGAILSIVECDAQGYTLHDRKRIQRGIEQMGRR